jgi:hypothetical protein
MNVDDKAQVIELSESLGRDIEKLDKEGKLSEADSLIAGGVSGTFVATPVRI